MDTVPVENGDDAMPVYRGPSQSNTTFTVVGLADMGVDPGARGTNRALTTAANYQEHFASQGDVIAIQIALADSAGPMVVKGDLQEAIGSSALGESLETMSVGEATEAEADRLSGGNDVIAAMLPVFAGISVIVAILVVSNTVSAIVAGRRREFALLRCLGASPKAAPSDCSVRSSVCSEARESATRWPPSPVACGRTNSLAEPSRFHSPLWRRGSPSGFC